MEQFVALGSKIFAIINQLSSPEDEQDCVAIPGRNLREAPPYTLLHGDYRCENMIWPPEGLDIGGAQEDVEKQQTQREHMMPDEPSNFSRTNCIPTVVDWELAHVGNPMCEV